MIQLALAFSAQDCMLRVVMLFKFPFPHKPSTYIYIFRQNSVEQELQAARSLGIKHDREVYGPLINTISFMIFSIPPNAKYQSEEIMISLTNLEYSIVYKHMLL